MKLAIMKTVIKAGGTVFGGAVRDYWLHDRHAFDFYGVVARDGFSEGMGPGHMDALYKEQSFLPEYRGRHVIPVDIDANIHADQLDALVKGLEEQKFVVRKVFDREPCNYLPNLSLAPGEMRHIRYRVYPFRSPSRVFHNIMESMHSGFGFLFKSFVSNIVDTVGRVSDLLPKVMLDVMVCQVPRGQKQPVPPFANLDFECNGLLMRADGGIMVSPYIGHMHDPIGLHLKLTLILDDILNFRARLTRAPVSKQRLKKMLDKGFTVCGFHNFQYIESQAGEGEGEGESSESGSGSGLGSDSGSDSASDSGTSEMREAGGGGCCDKACQTENAEEPSETDALDATGNSYEGHCIICHAPVTGNHYKMFCCDARYHARCLRDACIKGSGAMLGTEKCVMCRRSILGLESDYKVLSDILDIKSRVAGQAPPGLEDVD